MLSESGLTFEGKTHSGFDDSYNIARIMQRMLQDGYEPVMNDGLFVTVRQFAPIARKLIRTKPSGKQLKYVGLLWIDTVSTLLMSAHRGILARKGLYKHLRGNDPIRRIYVRYLNTKSGNDFTIMFKQ